MGGQSERFCSVSEGFEGAQGSFQELRHVAMAFVKAKDAWIGELSCLPVLAGSLAEVLGGLGFVQDVIHHLEHQSHGLAVGGERVEAGFVGRSAQGAHATRAADQRAGLVVVHQAEAIGRWEVAGESGQGVVHLTGDHGSGGGGQFPGDVRGAHW